MNVFQSIPFNPNWLVFREANYKAVLGYQKKDFQGVIDALGAGKIKPSRMITSRIQMDRIVNDGYWALVSVVIEYILFDIWIDRFC